MNDFFLKRSEGELRTLGIRGAFKFIVNDDLGVQGEESEEALKEVVRDWLEKGLGSSEPKEGEEAEAGTTNTAEMDDEVFMKSYIPRNLGEVFDPERDIDVIASGQGDDLIYAGVVGLATGKTSSPQLEGGERGITVEEQEDQSGGRRKSILKREDSVRGDDSEGGKKAVKWEDQPEESEEEEEDEDDDTEDEREKKPRGFRHEDKDSKKVSA